MNKPLMHNLYSITIFDFSPKMDESMEPKLTNVFLVN